MFLPHGSRYMGRGLADQLEVAQNGAIFQLVAPEPWLTQARAAYLN